MNIGKSGAGPDFKADLTGHTVAVVDDDPAVLESVSTLLQAIQLQPATFASAEEFLESGIAEQAVCLVLDVRMPGMSGMELQQVLKNRRQAIPIVMVTGHWDDVIEAQALRAGALDFIQKPYEPSRLIDIIARCLENLD